MKQFLLFLLISYLIACGARAKDRCAFHSFMPDYLFFECPSVGDYFVYLWQEQVWLWTLWFLSQIWITFHIWFPKSPRLASTEHLFGTPMYCSLFIDQSLVLNRRADGKEEVTIEDLKDGISSANSTEVAISFEGSLLFGFCVPSESKKIDNVVVFFNL